MTEPGTYTALYLALLPPVLMTLFGCATLLMGVLGTRDRAGLRWTIIFNLAGQLAIAAGYLRQWFHLQQMAQHAWTTADLALTIDNFSLFIGSLISFATTALLLISYRYLETVREHRHEYYALVLFAQCGMYFMAAATDLVALFIGIELTAISFYLLVGFTRADRRANEAALKYLLVGALSSSFIAYGFSLLYGLAGSTSLPAIAAAMRGAGPANPLAILGSLTVIIGLLVKISAVPFHTWAPDAYDGAASPVTAYLATASKVAAFAVLIRLLSTVFVPVRGTWEPVVTLAAVLSVTIGSIAAITQTRTKRLFAYSAVAHAGYLLFGFVAGSAEGLNGVYVYLLVYTIMNLGAFAVLISLRRHGITGDEVIDLRGLSETHPVHAALFAILLLSLAGIPPTGGFIAKYLIFAALIQTGHVTLAVLAAVYVAVTLYFYFRLIREMYLIEAESRVPVESSAGIRLALVVTAALTVILGIFPEQVLRVSAGLLGGTR